MTTVLYNGYYVNIDYGALTEAQRQHNALRLAQNLYNIGWTENAIAGLLGNAGPESTMNPGCVENTSDHPRPAEWVDLPSNSDILNSSYTGGCGVVQWTPATTKIVQFAVDTGRVWYDGMTQIFRFKYEAENGIQMTVSQWNWYINNDTDTPEDMAEYFLRQYERPSPQQIIDSLENRRRAGLRWYNYIHGKLFKRLFYLYDSKNKQRKVLKPKWQRV